VDTLEVMIRVLEYVESEVEPALADLVTIVLTLLRATAALVDPVPAPPAH